MTAYDPTAQAAIRAWRRGVDRLPAEASPAAAMPVEILSHHDKLSLDGKEYTIDQVRMALALLELLPEPNVLKQCLGRGEDLSGLLSQHSGQA